MTNEEKINRLMNIQRCTPIHTRDDSRDFEALEAAIEAIKILDKIESRLGIALKESEEESLAINRLIAVSGMSIEDLANAFTKGYRLVSPESTHERRISEKDWIPVSKRLPETDNPSEGKGYYLTTTKNREVYCDYWNGENFDRTETVIAWMPRPKPYEPQERSGEE